MVSILILDREQARPPQLANPYVAHARCALLLAINPKDARERIQLQKEKETLRKAQMHLQGFSHQVKGE